MSNDEMTTQPTINTLLARLDELRTGQIELRQSVEELRTGLEDLRKGQEELRTGLEDLRKGQEELRTGHDQLQTGLEDLRKGQEELRKGQEELRKGQEGLRADLNSGLRRVERKIEILNDNLLTIRADIRDAEVRIEKLESESLARS
jgi:uncharacterized phage infection (PIP) family protein YhgE